MPHPDKNPYDLETVLAEIEHDEAADRMAKRMLSQEEIQRLVEESRRRRADEASTTQSA